MSRKPSAGDACKIIYYDITPSPNPMAMLFPQVKFIQSSHLNDLLLPCIFDIEKVILRASSVQILLLPITISLHFVVRRVVVRQW